MKLKVEEYPFLQQREPVPKERQNDIASIRSWLKHQQHLPQEITDEHILLFLHSNYYSIEKTKKTIDSYFVVRAENPEIFSKWNIKELERSYEIYEMAPIPRRTPEGYKLLMYRLKDFDPSKIVLGDALRAFCAFNDVVISEDGLSPGYIVIFDMKGCTLSHLARVTIAMHFVRMFMVYIQECHPVRLKGVHVINTATFMDRVLTLIKPLMQSELVHLLKLHSSLETLKDYFPLDLLPEEYGGNSKSVTHLHDENVKYMKSHYENWLKDSENWIADLKKRPEKTRITDGMVGSFRKLDLD